MDDKQHNNDNSNIKYIIIFALILFGGIIIFNAINSPLIGGSNIIYVNNSAPSVVIENSVEQSISASTPLQNDESYQSSSDLPDTSSSDDIPVSEVTVSSQADESPQSSDTTSNELTGKININTADADELMKLPHVGEIIANRIIEYRKTNGDFKSIEELINVYGIGEKILDGIRDHITV